MTTMTEPTTGTLEVDGATLTYDVRGSDSPAPVLLLNGTADPQDPPSNVADADKELPNSLSLAIDGYGHTVGHIGCLPDVVAAFFEAGSVRDLDTRCVSMMRAPGFALP